MAKNSNFKNLGIAYDYYSIMHYSQWQCSYKYTSFGIYTATYPSMTFPKAFTRVNDVGQRLILSDKDIQHIKAIHCPSISAKH